MLQIMGSTGMVLGATTKLRPFFKIVDSALSNVCLERFTNFFPSFVLLPQFIFYVGVFFPALGLKLDPGSLPRFDLCADVLFCAVVIIPTLGFNLDLRPIPTFSLCAKVSFALFIKVMSSFKCESMLSFVKQFFAVETLKTDLLFAAVLLKVGMLWLA